MRDFRGKIAVITGAGSGMGRALALQLAREGAHVSICDVFPETLADTERQCRTIAPQATIVAQHCDVSDEAQVLAFRDAVRTQNGTDHIHLLFNNAGIGGGQSFIKDSRANWEKTFGVCWFGVYYCARAFLPMLIASTGGHIVNVSSLNAFFAAAPNGPHTAYSTAKAAVKTFSEALYTDLRLNAPHVKVTLVMPGHVGTEIVPNTIRSLGYGDPAKIDEVSLSSVRQWLANTGVAVDKLDDEELRAVARKQVNAFRDNAPLSPEKAASIILDGVRNERWRVLVGRDAQRLDQIVRENPEQVYEPEFLARVRVILEEERKKALAARDPEPVT